MKIIVISNESQKNELMGDLLLGADITWQEEPAPVENSTVYIDLLFTASGERINKFKSLGASMVIVNSVGHTLKDLPLHYARFNGWNSFLKNPVWEVCAAEKDKAAVANILSFFNKKIEWVADIKGFVTPRIISMIINEAYFALEEELSSKDEINTAMKLGTNYPYGPFEWAEKIGLKKIYELLDDLIAENKRYTPSSLLKQEALFKT